MASAQSRSTATGGMHLIVPVFLPLTAGSAVYALSRIDWRAFFVGPGRYSRLALLFFILANWKSMPFTWTTRIFYSLLHHARFFRRRVGTYPARTLFHPSITTSRVTLLETDYNMHKSNSTYFADLDASRAHLVMHLLTPGVEALSANAKTRLVTDAAGNCIQGQTGIMLGSVYTTFKREIPPFKKYEMWSRVLAWDRKWLYIATHFVQAGVVKPKGWDWVKYGRRTKGQDKAKEPKQTSNGTIAESNGNAARAAAGRERAELPDFQKRIYASSISKYVFKLGRYTVHPAIVMEESGLLPPRPGADGVTTTGKGSGWRGGPNDVGDEAAVADLIARDDFARIKEADDAEWDWRHIEVRRQRGMRFAAHFAALDGLHDEFDGGVDGALGRFPYG